MDFEISRDLMVREQLIARGIKSDKVLDAFRKVPREKFVSEKFAPSAYSDHPLPIGEGQTISQPYMVALMTEYLDLTGKEKVLEIGAGSGYQAAILAELTKEVYSVERIPSLAEFAKKNLDNLGYSNVKIKIGDGTLGWEELSPFDRIIVTAGAPKIPQSLINQLDAKGKLVIPVSGDFGQVLTLIEKENNKLSTTKICGCVFVPLIGKEAWHA